MATSVPAIKLTQTGLVLPQESAILAGVQKDIDQAFGGGVNPALETPQGQLAQSTTAIIGDANDAFAEFVNQVDPDFADGKMQDAIARIYFIDRKPSAPTAVQCVCTGIEGTLISVGAKAKDTSGNIYICTQAGRIPSGGSVTLSFANIESGPIACPAGTLTSIYKATPGWDTINNPADGVPGTLVESRSDFEYRRSNSVALNAHGSMPAIYAAVFNVPDVIDVYAVENVTDAIVNTGPTNYPLGSHSVYVAVVGGVDEDVARAIWSKKGSGCNYNGNTSFDIEDMNYDVPRPRYAVKFQRPDALPILFAVQIVNNPSLPANIVDLVKQAIIGSFTGKDGGQRARIGATIFASRFYGPVSLVSQSMSIISILIGTTVADQNSVDVGIDQQPTINESNISVTLV